MTRHVMQDLPEGAQFVGPDRNTRYEVTVPAVDDPQGFVQVRNLSMTDAEAQRLLATPGAVERDCDPRDGLFAFSHPTEVEVLP